MRSLCVAIALTALALTSCSSTFRLTGGSLDFFAPAGAQDPWIHKVQNWQARHRLDPATRGEWSPQVSELGEAYAGFERELRRRIVADTVAWVQEYSRRHYRPDGGRDHWATLGEVIASGEDDCDGLDLLTFVLLRRLGFGERELYRAIVVEDGTAQHHMVTLWFEGGSSDDPFVLDPTGVVSPELARLSEVASWEPIELFDEHAHYTVRSLPATEVAASE